MGLRRNATALKPLFRLLADESWLVRATAAEALGNSGDPRAPGWLIKLLADADGYVPYKAAVALRHAASESNRDLLLHAFKVTKPKQEFPIAVALAKLGEPVALGPLVGATSHTDPDMRRRAVKRFYSHLEKRIRPRTLRVIELQPK